MLGRRSECPARAPQERYALASILEDLLEHFADAADDLAGAFGGAHGHVFSSRHCALAHRARGVDGMQRHKISRSFTDAFGRVTSAFGRALSDVSRAATDVLGRAWAFVRGALIGALLCPG